MDQNSAARWRRFARWLEPGIGVKRWLGLIVVGTALIGLGLAIVLLDIYRAHPDSPWLTVLSLSALPRWLRALIISGVGVGLLIFSVIALNRTLLAPYLRPGRPVVDVVAKHRRLGRGPRIVTIGGGTGLSTLLRGLKKFSGNLTAIVTVADDGGSSGRLRRSLGLPPPGDIRACIAALSDDEDLLTQLFQYRFLEGEELNGHSFGNLFIAALAGVTGSFDQGIMEAARILSIRGTVFPSTMKDIALLADKTPEMAVEAFRIEGESQISGTPGRIRRVHLDPNDPPAYPGAIQAVLNADMIVIGPGSLYTSVIPNLLIPDLVKAIRASQAFKVFVCNVATQRGETDGYDCKQHVDAIERHIGRGLVDVVVANDCFDYTLPEGISAVHASLSTDITVPLYTGALVDPDRPWRHDSEKLADTLIALWEERTGPLDLAIANDLDSPERHN
ncbi:MAG TPA: YvcK family protein [Anaerolineae bacterium]|nr:YvcK family protein [Anaerolineae bacterium]